MASTLGGREEREATNNTHEVSKSPLHIVTEYTAVPGPHYSTTRFVSMTSTRTQNITFKQNRAKHYIQKQSCARRAPTFMEVNILRRENPFLLVMAAAADPPVEGNTELLLLLSEKPPVEASLRAVDLLRALPNALPPLATVTPTGANSRHGTATQRNAAQHAATQRNAAQRSAAQRSAPQRIPTHPNAPHRTHDDVGN